MKNLKVLMLLILLVAIACDEHGLPTDPDDPCIGGQDTYDVFFIRVEANDLTKVDDPIFSPTRIIFHWSGIERFSANITRLDGYTFVAENVPVPYNGDGTPHDAYVSDPLSSLGLTPHRLVFKNRRTGVEYEPQTFVPCTHVTPAFGEMVLFNKRCDGSVR
jgi:hypothetical protein